MEPIPFAPPQVSPSVRPARTPAAGADETPVSALAEAMRLRWHSGERPPAEDFLNQQPELWDRPDEALDLVYEEWCLREKYGPPPSAEEFFRRFPRWRDAIVLLLDCHLLMDDGLEGPRFPEAGDRLGDFALLAELGKGGKGRVFLATQESLGDRPVVLKLTPDDGREHLSLARLQHTHIVPLYASSVDPARGLRLLCMPYFGGATLLAVLQHLAGLPTAGRAGRDLPAVLDALQARLPAPTGGRGPTRQLLAGLSYPKAVCYLGACLADALHYAHERGLLHLDVKPSNVLLAADGTPMLLDFHLAHEPLPAGSMPTGDVGGTPAYMAPEQAQALEAVRARRPLPAAVDARADVFGLGVLLYELLGGSPPFVPGRSPPLHWVNPQVGRGLSDLVARALAARPEQRHATAAALADDLRRHLHDQPLQSVANRSLAERWRKWRRRHPSALRSWLLGASVLLATLAAGLALWLYVDHHIDEGEDALLEGRQKTRAGQHEEAVKAYQRGLDHLDRLPFRLTLAEQLRDESAGADEAWRQTRRARRRADLHTLAEQVRGLYGVDLSPAAREPLEERCRQLWEHRDALVEELDIRSNPAAISDLLDIALLWADWQAKRTTAGPSRALSLLAEAEALFGPCAVLDFARRRFRSESPLRPPVSDADTAWEHVALARGCLKAGLLANAEEHLERAIALRPDDRWSHFLLGLCAYRRGRYQDAVTEFTFCLGAAPGDAVCSYNRGLAYHALKDHRRALADYDRAVEASPSFAPAWQNRGLLHYAEKRHARARADFQRALQLGAPPSAIHLNLALVALAEDDRAVARTHLNRVLEQEPNHREARTLLGSLKDH